MKPQLLEDIGFASAKEDAVEEELTGDLPDSVLDIYSYSTQDLVNKYRQLSRRYRYSEDDSEKQEITELAELIEVELLKNGYEIESTIKDQ